tara:strand:+ start:113 stop:259 length:147 start_codon:yes stop_codon:yes gene_type:complete
VKITVTIELEEEDLQLTLEALETLKDLKMQLNEEYPVRRSNPSKSNKD